MSSGLILVDLQNDYFTGGTMALVGIDSAARNARKLLMAYRQARLPVIHIQHLAVHPEATFFLPETAGAEINSLVAPIDEEALIQKHFPNSFRETHLEATLRSNNIADLVICGAMSHMCIDATTRAAFDLGFNCTVAGDACATRDLTFEDTTIAASSVHAAFMAALNGTYAGVAPTRDLIAAMG